jgi:hypothetical protein
MVHKAQKFENSNFQMDFKWSTSLMENAIFLELGLYHSNYYINNVEATVDLL